MRPRRLFTTVLLTLCFACVQPTIAIDAADAGARRKPPAGYSVLEPKTGSGRILSAAFPRAVSAAETLKQSLADLGKYFDKPPTITAGVKDKANARAQAAFEAQLDGVPIHGLIITTIANQRGSAVVLFDRAANFAASFPALEQLLKDNSAGPAVQWTDTRLPDGSGTVKLPDGWTIKNANQGFAQLTGPNGAEAHFGFAIPVYTPAADANMRQATGGKIALSDSAPVAAYSDPAAAAKAVFAFFKGREKELADATFEVKSVQDVELPQGKAAFLYSVMKKGTGKTAEERHAFTYVQIGSIGADQWLYYESSVSAPADVFGVQFATMTQMWQSWKVSDVVFARRLAAAADAMTRTNQIMQEVSAGWFKASIDGAEAWDKVIRGGSYAHNSRTGENKWIPNDEFQKQINNMNGADGAGTWGPID